MHGKSVNRMTQRHTRSGQGHSPGKPRLFRGIPLGGSGSQSRVISGFSPDPWFITWDDGTNLSAFSCMAVELALFPEPTGNNNYITTCAFSAVQMAFNWRTVNAYLEITLLYLDGSTSQPFPMPFNSAAESLGNDGGPGDGPGYFLPQLADFPPLCNGAAQYLYYISAPSSDSNEGLTVLDADAFNTISGASVSLSFSPPEGVGSPAWNSC